MLGGKAEWWKIERSPGRAPEMDASGHLVAQTGTTETKLDVVKYSETPGETADSSGNIEQTGSDEQSSPNLTLLITILS